jgi:hypothetical protein
MNTLSRSPCKEELIRRLRTLRPETERKWGRMSVHQMVCHLCDSCRMATGEKTVSDETGPLQRTLVKWMALYAPLSWPAGIPTRPEIDQLTAGMSPGDFAADVACLEAMLEGLASRGRDAAWPRHPIFGGMSYRDWMRWAYLHTDHHLRQFGA